MAPSPLPRAQSWFPSRAAMYFLSEPVKCNFPSGMMSPPIADHRALHPGHPDTICYAGDCPQGTTGFRPRHVCVLYVYCLYLGRNEGDFS